MVDLDSVEDLRPLGRGQAFPEACRPLFVFDELSAVEINELRAQARRLADILGASTDGDVMSGEAMWVYADPSHEKFGESVASEAMSGGRAMLRGSSGLLEETDSDDTWVFVEKVAPADRSAWLSAKRTGVGRDPRLNEAGDGREGD